MEYADGEREYYDLTKDPNELDNAITTVPAARLNQLKTTLHTLEKCKGEECRA